MSIHLSLLRHPRVLFLGLAALIACTLAAGCDGRPSPEAMEEDAYRLYPPHALADPFTYNLVSGRREGNKTYPQDPRWLNFYHIVNTPVEDDDQNFGGVFFSNNPPLRAEVDLIPYPSGTSPGTEEIKRAKDRARAYWREQGLKLWGSEAEFHLQRCFYEYGNYCKFDISDDSLKYTEQYLTRAEELGNATAAYLHAQGLITKFAIRAYLAPYAKRNKDDLWPRLEKAARLGSPEAGLHMAQSLYYGNLLGAYNESERFIKAVVWEKNITEAVRLAEQSLSMGCVDSLPFLNLLYADPENPSYDLQKAHAFYVAHEGLRQYYRISYFYFRDQDKGLRGYADSLSPEQTRAAEEQGRSIIADMTRRIEEKKRQRLEHYQQWRAELLKDIDQSMPWLRFMLLPQGMAERLRDRMYVWAVEKGLADKTGPEPGDITLKRALTWDDYMEMDHEYRMKKWEDISVLVRWRYARPGEWRPDRPMWDNPGRR